MGTIGSVWVSTCRRTLEVKPLLSVIAQLRGTTMPPPLGGIVCCSQHRAQAFPFPFEVAFALAAIKRLRIQGFQRI